MCSETESSPRISFSSDLIHHQEQQDQDQDPLLHNDGRRDCNLLDSSSDFEFSVSSGSLDHQSSSADELFAGGVILPSLQLSTAVFPPNRDSQRNVSLPLPFDYENSVIEDRILNAELEEKKSIWGFKRSSSLNCELRKSLISSLPLLSRSNSTGSAPKHKDFNKQSSQSGKKASSGSNNNYVYSIPQKPPLKKYYSNGNGVKTNPVLNVPPPYIGKGAANLFGLGSFLRNGKDKNRR